MKRTIVRALALAGIAALLSACHGGGTGSGSMLPARGSTGGVGPYSGPAGLTFAWGSNTLQHNAAYLGPVTITGKLSLNLALTLRNAPGLLQYARSTADPHSGNYRHWLTPREIGAEFGASDAAVWSAEKYFMSYHLGVGTWPQHLMIVVTGSQANIEAAFGTKLGVWQIQTPAGPVKVYGPQPNAAPHFASALPVASVMNLVGLHAQHTFLERPGNVTGAGYSAPVIRNGFDYVGMINAGYSGQGINEGIIGTGPISSADVPAYATVSGNGAVATVVQKDVVAQPVDYNGAPYNDPDPNGLATPPPVTGPCSAQNTYGPAVTTASCNEEDGEAQLDTEQQAGMAPGATVDFYLAYNNQDCGPAYYNCGAGYTGVEGIYLVDDEIQQAIADNVVDTLSLSYGEGEPDAYLTGYFDNTGAGPGPTEFAALAAEGVTVFVSSGDNGAYQCDSGGAPATTLCASYPATDPSVISVGGVNASFTNSGQIQPSTQITAWAENTTYGGDGYFDNSAGSGGGPSQYFNVTSTPWQVAAGNASGFRGTPDISLLADPRTGPLLLMYAAFIPGYYFPSGGTSAAAPESAAMFADFLSACKANATCAHAHGGGAYGYRWGIAAATAFYAIATSQTGYGTQGACAGQGAGAFYDVCAGSNGVYSKNNNMLNNGFPASPGYDFVTGLGVPFGGFLVNALMTYCSCG
ncbi:MAG TPA: protease pro-enzyme activation domain-containing protein, partial [Candidatus Tyrphobacter sp.]